MSTTPLVLATSNAHKAHELQSMLNEAGLPFHVLTLSDVGITEQIDETGVTFEENAFIKAMAVHQATGLAVLADDSGLEVDVLDGLPGVRSARYAGEAASDADNRAKLKSELINRGVETSRAQFRCVICVVDATRTLLAEGASIGHVIPDERGTNGFGYDAMFIPSGGEATYGEISAEQKLATSHRGAAMKRMIALLRDNDVASSARDTADDLQILLDVVCGAMMPSTTVLDAALARVPDQLHHDVYELLLQSYLFGGFPTALDALQACHRVLGPPATVADVGVSLPENELRARGEVLCQEIYGHVYEKMMATLSTVSPDLASWMITEGYGKTLSRTGPSPRVRELCIVAMLTILGRRQQLLSHVRGAIRVGATRSDLALVEHTVTEHVGARIGGLLRSVILLQEGRFAND